MSKYNTLKLVADKLSSIEHSSEELDFLVKKYTINQISDEDMTSWLHAVYNNGMTFKEAANYTHSIISSGHRVVFDNPKGFIIDKHSTGGVGDKVSLILGPILAACGCYIPMIVGRSLGHTGGTLDKLESIKGYNGLIKLDAFKNIVDKVGISIIGQTDEICPADRKIYNLRDKTNTIASFPLICGSIMSKKIAEGISGLVLDIKVGNGAFMTTQEEGQQLGDFLSKIGTMFDVNVDYLLTDMNQPLGEYSGLLCEVYESEEALKGNGPSDLMKVVYQLAEVSLSMAKIEDPINKINNVLENGSALEKLHSMIECHGGDASSISLNKSNLIEVKANRSGEFNFKDTKVVGDLVNFITLNADSIDINAGLKTNFNNGDFVTSGDVLFEIFSRDRLNNELVSNKIVKSFDIIESNGE